MRYAWLTIKHKWFVFLAGLKVGVPIWRLLVHDLSKFTLTELPHYNRQFCGPKDDPEGFAGAWHHHILCNDHHPEHWTYIDKDGRQNVLRMNYDSTMEMVADWMGASRAYTKSWDMQQWLAGNFNRLTLHETTRRDAMDILRKVGYN